MQLSVSGQGLVINGSQVEKLAWFTVESSSEVSVWPVGSPELQEDSKTIEAMHSSDAGESRAAL